MPVLPRDLREILPRPEPHHRRFLDAQQGMARLQRQRSLRPCAGKLRRIGGVIFIFALDATILHLEFFVQTNKFKEF